MQVQLTPAGVAALNANEGPIILSAYKLGSSFNYIPDSSTTDIRGTVITSGTPSAPLAQDGNIVRYSIYLDYDAGPFLFGEFGLYMSNGVCFAVGVGNQRIEKKRLPASDANSLRLDIFLSMVGNNYDMWLDLAESSNKFQVASLQSPDNLPQPKNAVPNMYVIGGAGLEQSSMLAFTDRQGLWSFDVYAFANNMSGTVVEASGTAVKIALATFNSDLSPSYIGHLILQFTTGKLYGLCRYITSAIVSGNLVTLNLSAPLAIQPIVGDTFRVHSRQPLSTSNIVLPIATNSTLGTIMVGSNLNVTPAGMLSVNTEALKALFVTSVNGQGGEVELDANDIPGISQVGKDGQWESLQGKPTVFTPPRASDTVLGGVRIPQGGTITINPTTGAISLSFTPVTSVNGRTGDVIVDSEDIVGLVSPTEIAANTNLNTINKAGLYWIPAANVASITGKPVGLGEASMEVIPFNAAGDGNTFTQRLIDDNATFIRKTTNGAAGNWVAYRSTGALPVATDTTLGAVIIGDGLSVDNNGVVQTTLKSVNGETGPYILLDADDVNAVPTSAVGQPGGVATLNADPVQPPANQDVSDYVFGRMPPDQLPLGGLVASGTWNASTNVSTYTDDNGFVHTIKLQANGQILDTWTDSGSTAHTRTVSANGKVYSVSTAGATAIDGLNDWRVNDLAVAVGAKWYRLQASVAPKVPDVIDVATLNPAAFIEGAVYRYTGGSATVNITAAMAATWKLVTIYNDTAGSVLTFTGNVTNTASGGFIMPPRAIASLEWFAGANRFLLFGDTST